MAAYPPPTAAFRPAPLAHNLFFAAQPPADVAHRIGRAWRALGTVDPWRGEVLHMTVLRLGQVVTAAPPDPARIELAMREFRFPAFELSFERMATFGRGPDKKPAIVLEPARRSPAVDELARRIFNALWPGQHAPHGGIKVSPHVTLAYGAGFSEKRLLAKPIRWRIGEIALIDSLIGLTLHVPLARWRLGAG